MNESKRIVLIVDDTPENIDVARGILVDSYKVKAALNGAKALKVCQSDKQPDVVLLDMMMPEMDGFEVCEALKGNDQTKNIPVIFVSGETNQDEINRAKEIGAFDFITKPVDPNLLLQSIESALSN